MRNRSMIHAAPYKGARANAGDAAACIPSMESQSAAPLVVVRKPAEVMRLAVPSARAAACSSSADSVHRVWVAQVGDDAFGNHRAGGGLQHQRRADCFGGAKMGGDAAGRHRP